MKDFEREAFKLHSKSRSFAKKLSQSKEIISEALSLSSEWYIAFSGGKDSTVVLDIVRDAFFDVYIFWSDEEFFLPETRDYIKRLRVSGAEIRQCSGEIKHTDWFTSNKKSEKSGKTATAKSLGLDGVFLGLRAEENSYRRSYLRKYSPLHFSKSREMWQCNPIAWWSVKDVWAYILSQGIDYNKAYDRLSDIGVNINKQRIGPYATEKALGYGQLAILKMGWPEEYQRFIEKFPEAGRYV